MPDKPFVINDRRKFTAEGELRPDVPHEEPKPAPVAEASSEAPKGPQVVPSQPAGPQEVSSPEQETSESEPKMPPPPTAEQIEQAAKAYDATVDRLDTAIRAQNPGMDRIPEMTFDRLVQSVYMQAILQLGGGAQPGETPQVDLLGARQSIDMLNVLSEKTKGNLSADEDSLLQSALFEARMGFLEVTQLLARQAAAKAGGPGMPPPPGGGPQIVR